MVCRGWRSLAVGMAAALVLPLVAACESGGSGAQTTAAPQPISVEVNQSRDQYGKQAIQLQLTNTTDSPLTVTSARLTSALFDGDISWEPGEALELPPRQPKSLPARLPAAACGASPSASAEPLRATLNFAGHGEGPVETTIDASDPFSVLPRNAGELCLAADVAAVATIALAPELEVAPDGRTAVVRLLITPATTAGEPHIITMESVDGTTLLAEPPTDPWPRNIAISSGDPARELALRIRPARCDPHAVAEDKVGTLLPLRVRVQERQGLVKIAASNELRGRIYDFVTAACAHAG